MKKSHLFKLIKKQIYNMKTNNMKLDHRQLDAYVGGGNTVRETPDIDKFFEDNGFTVERSEKVYKNGEFYIILLDKTNENVIFIYREKIIKFTCFDRRDVLTKNIEFRRNNTIEDVLN
jgi:hypothetical protein